MKRKILSTILVLVLVLGSCSSAFADTGTSASQQINMSGLDKNWNLKTLKELPSGVVAKEFNSAAEADAYIRALDASINSMKTSPVIKEAGISSKAASATKNISNSWDLSFLDLTCLKVYGTITIESGKITKCNSCNCKLTGVTMGFDLTDKETTYKISKTGKSITLTSNATLDYYLIVNGLIKYYSRDLTGYSFTYTI